MAVTSEVRLLLDQMAALGLPPVEERPVAETRVAELALAGALAGPPEDVAAVDGRLAGAVPLRAYTPATSAAPRPLVVFFHGGGWVFGCIDSYDAVCRQLANAVGAVVLSVGYRLAPEHRFPAAADDAYSATSWAHANARELDADPERLVVMGDSAGGNLAAVTALRARDRGGPPIVHQTLIYPVTDAGCDTPSFAANGKGYFLEASTMRWFWDQYCPGGVGSNDPSASPLRAPDLSGLPPTLIVTAEYDPLRDEGQAYAARLRAAGVEVSTQRYDGMIHGFFTMAAVIPEAKAVIVEVAEAIAKRFA